MTSSLDVQPDDNGDTTSKWKHQFSECADEIFMNPNLLFTMLFSFIIIFHILTFMNRKGRSLERLLEGEKHPPAQPSLPALGWMSWSHVPILPSRTLVVVRGFSAGTPI